MVIVILDEFFIQLSDLLISFFIKGIDFIVFILDKFYNMRNLDNGMDSNNENDSCVNFSYNTIDLIFKFILYCNFVFFIKAYFNNMFYRLFLI